MDTKHIINLFEETQNTTPIKRDSAIFITVDSSIPDDEARQLVDQTLFTNTKYTTELSPPKDKESIHIATVPESTKQNVEYIDKEQFAVLIDDVF